MSIGKNIKRLRERADWTQVELAQRLGISDKTVSSWEIDRTQPKMGMVEKLADVLGCLKTDIIGADSLNIGSREVRQSVRIPVYGRIAAGIPMEMIEDVIDWEEIPAEMTKGGEYFCLQIHGVSMEPRMKEGDVIVCRRQPDAESGDIVVARINGCDATVKRLKKYAAGIMLIPLNQDCDTYIFSKDEVIDKPVEILGKVVELRAKF